MADTTHTTTGQDEHRARWAQAQADAAVGLRLAHIAERERALADARRQLAVAEYELMAAQQACDDY